MPTTSWRIGSGRRVESSSTSHELSSLQTAATVSDSIPAGGGQTSA
ncbi:hypothetical protein LINPERPRIM_LOCUS3930, partial [Linum perenne]